MVTGTVSWFNTQKGFGFIQPDPGYDEGPVFAHFSAINTDGFRILEEGQRVSFEIVDAPKGKQASNIRLL